MRDGVLDDAPSIRRRNPCGLLHPASAGGSAANAGYGRPGLCPTMAVGMARAGCPRAPRAPRTGTWMRPRVLPGRVAVRGVPRRAWDLRSSARLEDGPER